MDVQPSTIAGTIEVRFDRGTLVVDGPPDAIASLESHGLLWDPRVGRFRAPAYRHREIVEALTRQAATMPDMKLEPPRKNDSVDDRNHPAAPLRPYQQDALGAWQIAGQRGVVVLPTGAGKTHVAMGAIARIGGAALVLVPTRVLLEQWARCARDVLGVTAALYGDGEHHVGPLTVCTFESAFRRMDEFGDRFDLLVVDEAHHFGSGARCEALEMCMAHARLGLTATPPTAPETIEVLDRLVGPIVFQLGIHDLAGTHLAPFEHELIRVSLDTDEQVAYAAAHGSFLEAMRLFRRSRPGGTWADFVRAAMQSAAGRQALAGHREARRIVSVARAKLETVRSLLHRHHDERTLAFTADNTAAYALSRELLVPAITCDVVRREREEVLSRFRNGEVRAIVSARVLNEGIDVPEARIGVVLGGSLGPREHVQRVGRLLRPAPGKTAHVYEIVVRGTFEDFDSQRRRRSLAV
jgi:superfamily II DNA or RNA helicase